ncbi:hypothetical protein DOTSEDRAFT_74872 [Dothistroma septosporum NZE10]|uniref:DUF1772-domain-containing protein n=1 Tax=Dothistroma septosporum (strain NZE10 / CBS 128990) TaxID=675120 RepID=N1PD15_DOTSN|nr:hypothetical protein DOTSEDRAFT_74872 [Dothistroma septosporum NZE10]
MPTDSRTWIGLKGIALASTFAIASAQATTALVFIPALLRPLESSKSASSSPSQPPSRPSSSLRVPSLQEESGRLTPSATPSSKFFDFSIGSSGAYRAVAQQFARMDALNLPFVVPLELFAIGIFSVSAYRARTVGNLEWRKWASAAAVLGSVFPYTLGLMGGFVLKIKRIAGDEEKIEPYEDAPPDREMEKSNTVEFVKSWNTYNVVRAGIIYVATFTGLAAFALE